MDEINEKASQIGRILTIWMISANQGMPAVVLSAHLRILHRATGELLEMLEDQPSTTVHVNPTLPEGAVQLLSDYFQGRTETPDTIPDWMNDGR